MSNMNQYKVSFGDPDVFQIQFGWMENDEYICQRPQHSGWSWAEFALIIRNQNITGSIKKGSESNGFKYKPNNLIWYSSPLMEWFMDNFDNLFNLEGSEYAWIYSECPADIISNIMGYDGDDDYDSLINWYQKHCMSHSVALEGSVACRDVYFHRKGDDVVISWNRDTFGFYCHPSSGVVICNSDIVKKTIKDWIIWVINNLPEKERKQGFGKEIRKFHRKAQKFIENFDK